jgi:hypothetical protein
MMACVYESIVNSEYTNSARKRITHSALLDSPFHISFSRAMMMPGCPLRELTTAARQPAGSVSPGRIFAAITVLIIGMT